MGGLAHNFEDMSQSQEESDTVTGLVSGAKGSRKKKLTMGLGSSKGGSLSRERSGDGNDEGGSPFGARLKGPSLGASGRRQAAGDSIERDSELEIHRKSVEQSSVEGDADGLLDTMYGGASGGTAGGRGGRRPVPGKDFIMDDKDVDPKLLAKYRTKTSGQAGKRIRKVQGTDADLESNVDEPTSDNIMGGLMRPVVPQCNSFCQTEVNAILMASVMKAEEARRTAYDGTS